MKRDTGLSLEGIFHFQVMLAAGHCRENSPVSRTPNVRARGVAICGARQRSCVTESLARSVADEGDILPGLVLDAITSVSK